MDVYKICRCCLTNEAPLLTIYDGETTNKDDLAGMINKVTGIKLDPNDKLPDKACFSCIIEIKRFYAFKIKCENSHETLQQLCVSKAQVNLYSSIITPSQSEDTTENNDNIIMGMNQETALESEVNNEYSQSAHDENNIETNIPTCYVYKSVVSLEDDTTTLSSSPVEQITHLEENTQSLSPETTANTYTKEFTDSDTNSCDSMEFISEEPQVHVLNELDAIHNTISDGEFNDTAVVYSFINVSSPQFVPEEVINISLDSERTSNILPIDSSQQIHIGKKPRKKRKLCKRKLTKKKNISNEIMHTFNRPYKCRYCDEAFVTISSRRSHEIFHTGTPYKCKHCQRGFINLIAKDKHEEAHKIPD